MRGQHARQEVRLAPVAADVDITCAPFHLRDALLWKVALWTARGRVPLGTPLDQPVYLKHWPDLNALTPLPQALRMAALWLNHPLPLLDGRAAVGATAQCVQFLHRLRGASLAGPALGEQPTPSSTRPSSRPRPCKAIARLTGRLGRGPWPNRRPKRSRRPDSPSLATARAKPRTSLRWPARPGHAMDDEGPRLRFRATAG